MSHEWRLPPTSTTTGGGAAQGTHEISPRSKTSSELSSERIRARNPNPKSQEGERNPQDQPQQQQQDANYLRQDLQQQHQQPPPPQQVQSHRTGKTTKPSSGKDRHSKVNTARGPRDRRVRLSVSTAIQFYDIQDRLGFDQPSKAIEWLLKKAKPAIDELSQLPPTPLSIGAGGATASPGGPHEGKFNLNSKQQQQQQSITNRIAARGSNSEDQLESLDCDSSEQGLRIDSSELFGTGSASSATRRLAGKARPRTSGSSKLEVSDSSRGELARDSSESIQNPGASTLNPLGTVFDHHSVQCSSFTQLLQSPFPSSLHQSSFLPSSHHQQSGAQMLQGGLYHHHQHPLSFPPPAPGPAPGLLLRYGAPGAGPQSQEQEFLQGASESHHLPSGSPAAQGAFFSESQALKSSYSHHPHPHPPSTFHSLMSPGSLFSSPGGSSSSSHHWASSHQPSQAAGSNLYYNYRSTLPPPSPGLYSYNPPGLSLHQDRPGLSQTPAANQAPFYLVPGRIQGLISGEDDDSLQSPQDSHHQQKRQRQDE